MMLIVSVVSETGVFNYVGLLAFKWTKGRPWPLLVALCVLTGLLSAVLDNVTTVLLMTPVTIQLCEVVGENKVQRLREGENFERLALQ